MKSITTSADLKIAIQQLELQQINNLQTLKETYNTTYESFKPLNLLKGSLKNAAADPELKTDVLNGVVGLATGVLAKKLLIGKTGNPFKMVVGLLMELGIAKTIADNSDKIKAAGNTIYKTFFSKKEENTIQNDGEHL